MNEISGASRVYVNSNAFIYFLEASPELFLKAKEFFEHADKVGSAVLTNEYTAAECIYQPSRNGNLSLVAKYESLFGKEREVELLGLDGALARRAALAGGALGLKVADAIHFVSALKSGCDFFVTAHAAFKSCPAMKVLRLAA